MWKNAAMYTAVGGVSALAGVYIGARWHDHHMLRSVVLYITPLDEGVGKIDRSNPASVLAASVFLANQINGLAILSTVNENGGVSTRMMQPLPIECCENGDPVIVFHSSSKSRKFTEMAKNPKVSMAYVDPTMQSCISFRGQVERLSAAEEKDYSRNWPLLPPLSLFYQGETIRDFSAWRLRPERVEVVSTPAHILTRGREDWKGPALVRGPLGWEFEVKPMEK